MKHPRLIRFKPRRRATRDTSKLPALRALSLATCNSSLAPCNLSLATCNSSLEPCALQLETVPYDEHLLERSCTQWQFGDWQSLAKISRQILQHHPDRGKLALFTAAGLLQTDEHERAKEFVRLALNWGVTKKQVCQILVAGVHNSLGRAAALGGQEERAYQHFEESITIGMPGNCAHLLAPVRFNKEITCLNNYRLKDEGGHLSFKVINCQDIQQSHLQELSSVKVVRSEIDCGGTVVSISYRPESIGDKGVIQQVFINKDYDFSWYPQAKKINAYYNNILINKKIPFIIDAGANIGASSLWFANEFKESLILAIEPEQNNCELLKENCAQRDIHLFQGGLSDGARTMYLHDPGESDWGFRLADEPSEVPIKCIGIDEILSFYSQDLYLPLILKLDIEGSENMVFKSAPAWIGSFPLIIIELHDWLFPNKNISKNFFKCMATYDFEIISKSENLFCFNKKKYRSTGTDALLAVIF